MHGLAKPGIHWHGPTTDVAAVWRENHVAMLLSYREGLPRTLVEAAAAGPANRHNRCCRLQGGRSRRCRRLLMPARDADAACEAILRLASDPQLRTKLGAAARKRFLEGFTEQVVRETMQNVYRNALSLPQKSGEAT